MTVRLPLATMARLGALTMLLSAVAACGGGSSPVFDQSAPGSTIVSSNTLAADTTKSALSPEQLTQVTDAYHQFLTTYDLARIGDPQATTELRSLATTDVVAQVDAWKAHNDQLSAQRLGTISVTSVPNIAAVSGAADSVVVTDCVEEQAARQALNLHTVNFVDQVTHLNPVNGGWQVDKLQVRNDGTLGSGQLLGCVPTYHRDRLTSSMNSFMTALEGTMAKPDKGLSPEFKGLVEDSVVPELDTALKQQVADGWYISAPTEHKIDVLGSDLTSGGTAFVVAVCTTYPEGGALRSLADDKVLADQPAGQPGQKIYQEFKVRATKGPDGTYHDKVFDLQRRQAKSGCGAA